jgi:glutamyl-tRNA reductase
MDDAERKQLEEQYKQDIAQELTNLAEYRKALEEEWKDKKLDDPETAEQARATIIELVPDAATALRWLIVHSDSDSVRMNIAKWVMERAQKRADADDSDKALHDLINSITKKTTDSPINDR